MDMDGDTVWLSQKQMAELFGKDQSVISRHIKNAITEGEIDITANYAKIAHPAENVTGSVEINVYDLAVVISVGDRVHSQRGVTSFRATSLCSARMVIIHIQHPSGFGGW